MKLFGKMSDEQKQKLSEAQKRRYAKMKKYYVAISITVPVVAKDIDSAIDKIEKKYNGMSLIVTDVFDNDGKFLT